MLAPLAANLTTTAVQKMNTRVSSDGVAAETVAIDFLKQEGFLK